MEFADQFCLRDRDNFVIETSINPEDKKFYFGRSDLKQSIQDQLTRAFITPGTPKMILYGPFGSGKTQTLAHMKYMLEAERPRSLADAVTVYPVDVPLEMKQKSDAQQFHLQLVEALGKDKVCSWVDSLFSTSYNFDQDLEDLFPGDTNMVQCMKNLRGGGDPPLTAWKWLSGRKLTGPEQQRLQASGNLGEVGVHDFVKVLVGFGRLAEKLNEKLIFLVDECECLNRVTDADAAESVHDMIRQLADLQNRSTGFVLATFGNEAREIPPLMMREDVTSRIGNLNIVEILTIDQPANVEQFMKELLAELVDQDQAENRINSSGLNSSRDIFPFEPSAFDQFCRYATANPGDGTPRKIISCLNECSIDIWTAERGVIDEETVDKIAPLVFNG